MTSRHILLRCSAWALSTQATVSAGSEYRRACASAHEKRLTVAVTRGTSRTTGTRLGAITAQSFRRLGATCAVGDRWH